MSSSLQAKAISGLSWSFTDNLINLGISFFFGIILARLLSPQEFGLIGMVTIFIAISNSFIDSGFREALIRKQKCSDLDYSTVFYYNLVIGVGLYLALYFSAGLIAGFFNEPRLISIVRVLSLSLIVASLSAIQQTILIKNINFKLLTKITVISSVLSGFIGVIMAATGFGVWSLVFKTLFQNFFITLLLWFLNGWRPVLAYSSESFKEMFGFGSKLFFSYLLLNFSNSIYHLLIGRFFSATALGFYTRAEQFKQLPTKNLDIVISRVTYPVLSIIQDDNDKLKKVYKKLVQSTVLLTFPLMIGMAAVAEPMIITLIGEQWLPSVPFLQLMCFSAMLYPLNSLNLNMLKVKGRSDLVFKLVIIRIILSVPVIIVGVIMGIIEMLIGMIIISVIYYFINCYWSGKIFNYTIKEQLNDIMPIIIYAIIMGALVYGLSFVLGLSPLIELIIQIIAGGLFTVIFWELVRYNPYYEVKNIIISIFLKIWAKRA